MVRSSRTIPCLCFVVATLIGGGSIMHWNKLMENEIAIARRSGAKFESMYRNALEELAEWRNKYDEERRKNGDLSEHIKQNEEVMAQLRAEESDIAQANGMLSSAKEKLEDDLNQARASLIEEQSVREQAEVQSREVGRELEELRTAQHELEAKESSRCASVEAELAEAVKQRERAQQEQARVQGEREQLEADLLAGEEARQALRQQLQDLEAWKKSVASANTELRKKQKQKHLDVEAPLEVQHRTKQHKQHTAVSHDAKQEAMQGGQELADEQEEAG